MQLSPPFGLTKSGQLLRGGIMITLCVLLAACLAIVGSGRDRSASAEPTAPADAYLDRLIASGVPGVAVVVTRQDQVVLATGRGTDGRATVDADTRFRAASLSKSFTATAVLQLVEQHKVDLERPVISYLPEFGTADPRSDLITVRQLLNQSSGLTDKTLGFNQYAEGPRTAAEATAKLRSSRLAYDPGTSWDYCNPNYWVAARLVEVVSGEDYAGYLKRHVFTPLGMTGTTQVDVDAQADDTAAPHTYRFGHPVRAGARASFSGGAGGIVTTANDLSRWLRFQRGFGVPGQLGHVLGPDLIAEMHRRQSPLHQYAVGYALGWWNGEPADGGTPRISHSGTGPGVSAYQGLFPDGTSFGVLVNASLPEASEIAGDIRSILGNTGTPDQAQAPSAWPDIIAALIALSVVALCARGVRNAGRWLSRRGRWSRGLILAHLTFVAAGVLLVPWAGGRWLGRQADWIVLYDMFPMPTVAAISGAAAMLLLVVARTGAWLRNPTGAGNSLYGQR